MVWGARDQLVASCEGRASKADVQIAASATAARRVVAGVRAAIEAEGADRARRLELTFARKRADLERVREARVARADGQLDQAIEDADRTFATLLEENRWALSGFEAPEWDRYEPDLAAGYPETLRVGLLTAQGDVPPLPALVPFAGHGHVLFLQEPPGTEAARPVLQSLALRLIVSTAPGTIRSSYSSILPGRASTWRRSSGCPRACGSATSL